MFKNGNLRDPEGSLQRWQCYKFSRDKYMLNLRRLIQRKFKISLNFVRIQQTKVKVTKTLKIKIHQSAVKDNACHSRRRSFL